MVKKLKSYQEFTFNTGGSYERRKLHGRTYLVIPTVMIKEGVWTGNNGPIFYPDRENHKSSSLWDHKPVTVFHPSLNGRPTTACSPKILDRQMTGFMLNTRNKDKSLGTKVWLEERKLKRQFPEVYDKVIRGEKIDVSTGLKMTLVLQNGVWKGKKYIGRATEYQPDHLAILPGKTGACSLKDGAGLYQINQMIHNGLKEDVELDDEGKKLVNRIAKNLQKLVSNTEEDEMVVSNKRKKLRLAKKLIQASNGSLTQEDDLTFLMKKDEKYLKKQLAWYENEKAAKKKKRVEDEEDEEDLVDNEDEEDDEDLEDLEEEEDEDDDEHAKSRKKVKFTKEKTKKKTKKAVAKNEEDDEEDEEDDEPVTKKKKNAQNEKDKEMAFLASMPKSWRKKFLRMQQNEEAEKERLVEKIMSNPRNEFSEKFLNKKELEELRALAKLVVKNDSDDDDEEEEEDEMFRAVGGGREDDSDTYNEDGDDPDILPLPSLVAYNERLNDLRKNDSRVGNKRRKEKVA